MKKLVRFAIVFILVLLCIAAFSACKNITEEEKAVVGRYNLTEIIGLYDNDDKAITVDFFEENYIILSGDKSFKIYNLQDGLEYTTTGEWSLSGQTLTLKLSGMFAKKEKHLLQDGTITLNGKINGQNVTMTFVKAAE